MSEHVWRRMRMSEHVWRRMRMSEHVWWRRRRMSEHFIEEINENDDDLEDDDYIGSNNESGDIVRFK